MQSLLIPTSPRICLRLTIVLVSLLFTFITVNAQGVGSSRGLPGGSGRHTIKGRVFAPSGKPYEGSVKVRLDGNIIGSSATATDTDGAFIFNNIPAGNYVIAIDAGPNFEPIRESVIIYGSSGLGSSNSTQTINVPINLRAKGIASAAGTVNAALAGVPKAAVDLFYKARESADKKDHQKAVDQLKAALAIHSNFPLALSELGVQYLKIGRPDKAAETLQEALKLAPDDVSSRLNYGVALLNLKKFGEAEKELREVLKRNDALPTAHMSLGIALMSQKRLDEAEQELVKATASNSSEIASAHRYLGGIYWGKRDYKKAADELEMYLKLAPKAADAEKTQAAIKELRSKQ